MPEPDDGACFKCGSPNTVVLAGCFRTGVVAPDGYCEYRWEEWVQCRDCGAREEL
jgi:hypothetical protein